MNLPYNAAISEIRAEEVNSNVEYGSCSKNYVKVSIIYRNSCNRTADARKLHNIIHLTMHKPALGPSLGLFISPLIIILSSLTDDGF